MANKKVSEMNPEELERHRALANERQRRHRAQLQGKALEEYRARRSRYQKRYREAHPSRHRKGRAIEAGDNGQGKHERPKLRMYVEIPQRPRRKPVRRAMSSDEEEDIVSDHSDGNNGRDGDEVRDNQASDKNQQIQASEDDEESVQGCKSRRGILRVNSSDDDGEVNQGVSDVDDGMEWNNGDDGMDVNGKSNDTDGEEQVDELYNEDEGGGVHEAVMDESRLRRDMLRKLIPHVAVIREAYDDDEGEGSHTLPILPARGRDGSSLPWRSCN
ncbi:hypothetical protein L210DRAFT_936058 [Boletus edulis BED1]|uniref:Uncharacterized protein n=1 Tax=Boletus edulis BED1 TaxID=1328754 RepID=A0AAD4G3Z2_BOLED|nr:hypothetical protein L210DRAFT_936058 [Boletus edulis BED1]